MDTKLLGIYLNDHLAGSVVGGELAKRAASSNSGTELGDFLAGLAQEIDDERQVLKSILDHIGVPQNRFKAPIAWGAEKLGRLKPNGQLTGYSPLSRLVELEGLMLGVTGKLGMWRALHANQTGLESFGLEDLIAQAEAQRDGLEKRRLEAAGMAFGTGAAATSA
jgi:ethanolamine ammonia-lyase large subunit